MCSHFYNGCSAVLSDDEKAAAINLVFLMDIVNFDKCVLKAVSEAFDENYKLLLYDFWKNLSLDTARAWLCMVDYEGKI